MRWRRGRTPVPPGIVEQRQQATRDPLVLAITEPVTRETAPGIVARVSRVAASSPVVVDLTGIPDFDSDGAAALVGLQESMGSDRVTILGFRQATARIIGSDVGIDTTGDSVDAVPRPAGEWALRRLRAISVIQVKGDVPASTDGLEPLLHTALGEEGVPIVVVDLRNAELTRAGIDVLAFASSSAALAGRELLVVNVDATTGEELRRAGLSATTYVAPQPID